MNSKPKTHILLLLFTNMATTATTKTLILGGTGATGKHLVSQLLEKNQEVRVIVRSKVRLMESLTDYAKQGKLTIFEGTALDMEDDEFEKCVEGCDAVVSCLGHRLTCSGIYGEPRKLVTDTIQKVCDTVTKVQPSKPVKVILMGTNGAPNPDGSDDVRSLGERIVLSLIRLLLPPHVDNEAAAEYLGKTVGTESSKVAWCVVRPDDLIDGDVSEYKVEPRATGSLFGGGETSRSNVAAFMTELILKDSVWGTWKYKMPVLRNANFGKES